METLGTEVNQKMRSAVKAKLIELGTGGSAGYIDDELPDYVMIMVANKRPKQQMISDLNLFLGSQTELFVTWLHEVLQKLQEVTLPANVVQKAKRKATELEATAAMAAEAPAPATKKEKRDKKKDKRVKRTNFDKPVATTAEEVNAASISDVVADHLLQRAKKTMEVEASVQIKGKKEQQQAENTGDEFDIPTITEIAERRETEGPPPPPNQKELIELAALQKKIDQAKRQLKAIESDESEDEDFLNIKEDVDELDDDMADKTNKRNRAKSPIVFDRKESSERESPDNCNNNRSANQRHVPLKFSGCDDDEGRENHRQDPKTAAMAVRSKRPVHERLGLRSPPAKENVISLSAHRRVEKELYVPAFRRNEMERERQRNLEREMRENPRDRPPPRDLDRDRPSRDLIRDRPPRDLDRDRPPRELDRDRLPSRDLERVRIPRDRGRERERSPERDSGRENAKPPPPAAKEKVERVSIRQRIGSRVIVAPQKPEFEENNSSDLDVDRPVNSVIKIKPRPAISPSRQASKNLLLRAVAEAQKSIALVKPRKERSRTSSPSLEGMSRTQKLYSKSYRDRNREALLKRAAKDNIVIEVNAEKTPSSRLQRTDDEYIPEPISDRGDSDNDLIYVPQTIVSENSENEEFDDLESEQLSLRSRTQFVVTLDDQSREKFVSKHKIRVVDKTANGFEIKRLDMNNDRHLKPKRGDHLRSSAKRTDSPSSYPQPKEVKKLIIKNDTEDEDSTSPTKDNNNRRKHSISVERSTTPPLPPRSAMRRKRSAVSPIKFDLDEHAAKRRSKSGERDSNDRENREKVREPDASNGGGGNTIEENLQKISTKKIENKYDNIPEFLSSVPVDTPTHLIKPKVKERCKYFPSCGKGDSCEFHHPTIPCKAFPNCKFADKCMFLHPKCKFDLTCNRVSCNFQHSAPVTQSTAPPLSSHVVPVQNYKSIIATPLPAICKYYPNCTNSICNFYHPKLCRFGKNCMNKVECNFYHHDIPPIKDKFKWVASLG